MEMKIVAEETSFYCVHKIIMYDINFRYIITHSTTTTEISKGKLFHNKVAEEIIRNNRTVRIV